MEKIYLKTLNPIWTENIEKNSKKIKETGILGRSFEYVHSNGDVYPCSNYASELLFLAGNLYEKQFFDIWETSFKDLREITWNHFKEYEACKLNKDYVVDQFCKLRCPPLSKVIYDDPFYWGGNSYAKTIFKMKLKRLLEWLLGGWKYFMQVIL